MEIPVLLETVLVAEVRSLNSYKYILCIRHAKTKRGVNCNYIVRNEIVDELGNNCGFEENTFKRGNFITFLLGILLNNFS